MFINFLIIDSKFDRIRSFQPSKYTHDRVISVVTLTELYISLDAPNVYP